MRFKVGPWAYRVRIGTGLKDEEGKPASGLCDRTNRTIWICNTIHTRTRLKILFHELRHAWQFELGRTFDVESDANQSSAFAADVWRQLERQGGEAALMRLTMDGIADSAVETDLAGEPRAAQCPECNGLLSMPIRTGTPTFEPTYNRLVSHRSADCEFCGHTVSWKEGVTSLGAATGQVFGEPIIGSPGGVSVR